MNGKGLKGKDVEDRLKSKLQEWCTVSSDETMDHEFKVDIIIHNFKKVPKYEQIGIQVTIRDDDIAKQQTFLDLHKLGHHIRKTVYLEVDSQVNLEGTSTLVCFALASYLFDQQYRDKTVIGLRVNSNFTYEFFDLEGNIQKLRSERAERAGYKPSVGDIIEGEIKIFFPQRNFGFIKHDFQDHFPDFFFHAADANEALGNLLRERVGNQTSALPFTDDPIDVDFCIGEQGVQKNPRAYNIRLKRKGLSVNRIDTP